MKPNHVKALQVKQALELQKQCEKKAQGSGSNVRIVSNFSGDMNTSLYNNKGEFVGSKALRKDKDENKDKNIIIVELLLK